MCLPSKSQSYRVINGFIIVYAFLFIPSLTDGMQVQLKQSTKQELRSDTSKRKALLKGILKLLPEDNTKRSHISYWDKDFKDWLTRTGELPPNFDKMPSIPYLPNPLIIDEGGKNILIKNKRQWK